MKYRAKIVGIDPTNPNRREVHTEGLPARLAHNRVLFLAAAQFAPAEKRSDIAVGTEGTIEYVTSRTGAMHYFTINV